MSVSKAGDNLFLEDDAFRSEAEGRAEVVRSLAGRARVLYELATGSNPFPDEPAASVRNPQGQLGIDLSGPPWGSALLHPIAWCTGAPSTSNVQGERAVATVADLAPKVIGPWTVYNRRHDRLPAPAISPYARGYLRIRGSLTTAGSATLTIKVAEGLSLDSGFQRSTTQAITSTTDAAFAPSIYFDLVPGWNRLWIHLSVGAGDETVRLSSIAIHQVAKRSH